MYFIHNIWCTSFTIYDVLHSQYMTYFIYNIWCILFTIYDYFIHNIWCILFTIYDYFIHKIWCTSFTIYDVFYSRYIVYLFTIYYILFTIWYFIHNIVNKIRHKRCSAFAAFLYVLDHSVSSCNYLLSCSPAVSLHTKTNRQAWKSHRCSFSNFLFEFTVRWDGGLPD